MSARTAGQVALLTTGALVTGLIGYAVYFDYMRRHSADFRRGIKKQQKKLAAAADAQTKAEKEKNSKALRLALIEIQNEAPPQSPEQQEAYFQEQVAQGEKLAVMGPEHQVDAASHFYRALRVYPQPFELLTIYQKVVPAPIFSLVIELTSLSGGGPAAGGPAGVSLGGLEDLIAPAQQPASVADLDDSPAEGSPKADSATSGASWEKVDEA